MYLERKEPRVDVIYENINLTEEEVINTLKKKIDECTNMTNTIVNADFDKLSNEEFYSLISSLYFVNVWQDDYLDVLSKLYGNKYEGFITVPTNIFHKVWKKEGYGRNTDIYEQVVFDEYTAAVPYNHELCEKDYVTREELEKYTKDNSIVLIDRKEIESYDEGIEVDKDYVEFSTLEKEYKHLDEATDFFKKNLPLFVDLFRKDYNKERVLEDLKDYLYEFSSDLNDSIEALGEIDYEMASKANKCRIWYNNSSDGLEFQKMLKSMNV